MSRNTNISNTSEGKYIKPRHAEAHILVIRFSALGDVAMLAPVLRVVADTYPKLKITLLTRKFFSPIFKDISNVKIYEADINGEHSGVFGLSRLAKDLRDLDIDAVADVHDVLRSNVLKSVFYFYGIPVKQIDKGRAEKKALSAANNKVFKQLKTTPQRYADVFEELGYPINLSLHKFPEKQKISPNIRKITGTTPLKWLGIAPFAQHNSKVYPLDLMEQVLLQLEKAGKSQVFLFGGGKEEVKKLAELASKFERVTSLAGQLTFEEELALISNLDAMLSMDSGNAHLAAIYGTPTLTIWGVTHPYAGFIPFGQPMENCILPDLNKYPQIPTSIYGNRVPAGYEDVMRNISPEYVALKINEILNLKS